MPTKKKKGKPIVINASFEQLVKESVAGNPTSKQRQKNKQKTKVLDEFTKIKKMLKSNDEEMVDLGITLANNYADIKNQKELKILIRELHKIIEESDKKRKQKLSKLLESYNGKLEKIQKAGRRS